MRYRLLVKKEAHIDASVIEAVREFLVLVDDEGHLESESLLAGFEQTFGEGALERRAVHAHYRWFDLHDAYDEWRYRHREQPLHVRRALW